MGIEPTLSAWKAEVLPLNYARSSFMEGEGFEPSKAEPSDLQSDPFGRSGTPPTFSSVLNKNSNGFSLRMFTLSRQVSRFFPRWSWRSESNRRPTDYKSVALPTELRQHPFKLISGGQFYAIKSFIANKNRQIS